MLVKLPHKLSNELVCKRNEMIFEEAVQGMDHFGSDFWGSFQISNFDKVDF